LSQYHPHHDNIAAFQNFASTQNRYTQQTAICASRLCCESHCEPKITDSLKTLAPNIAAANSNKRSTTQLNSMRGGGMGGGPRRRNMNSAISSSGTFDVFLPDFESTSSGCSCNPHHGRYNQLSGNFPALFAVNGGGGIMTNNKESGGSLFATVKKRLSKISNVASLLCVVDCTVLPFVTVLLPLLGIASYTPAQSAFLDSLGHSVALFFVLPGACASDWVCACDITLLLCCLFFLVWRKRVF